MIKINELPNVEKKIKFTWNKKIQYQSYCLFYCKGRTYDTEPNDESMAQDLGLNLKNYRKILKMFNPAFVDNNGMTVFFDKKMAEKAADYLNIKYVIMQILIR